MRRLTAASMGALALWGLSVHQSQGATTPVRPVTFNAVPDYKEVIREHNAAVILWDATVLWNKTIAAQEAAAKNTVKIKPSHNHTITVTPHTTYAIAGVQGSGACGGNLPPCSVMRCENGGKLTGRNPINPRVSGKWQIDRGTWNNYKGYAEAQDAPESVQDERAAQIYAGGRGRSQWAC